MKKLLPFLEEDITTDRLEAFSDGVLAVVITIMVLELKPPQGASAEDLTPVIPILLAYILSFVFIAIYWNNHHQLFHATKRVTGGVMWANLHLLFWLSLIPAATAWVGEHPANHWPAALYGIVAFGAAIAYFILLRVIIRSNLDVGIHLAIGRDMKGKISPVLYLLAVILAFVNPMISYAIYALVAAIWIVPDRRLAKG